MSIFDRLFGIEKDKCNSNGDQQILTKNLEVDKPESNSGLNPDACQVKLSAVH